jgi:membrane-associated phospholipid phosphatase
MWFTLIGLLVAWAVMLLFGGMEFDRGLLMLAYADEEPQLAEAARWATELGGATVLLVLTGLGAGWLLARREWRLATFLLGITLSGRLLVSLQKDWTARLRPDAQGHLVPVESLAFPSGHAANATMVLLCLALLLPTSERWRGLAVWAAVWLALAIGISRVMLGVHWPSDVIGGWAFGLFWTLLILHLSGLRVNEGTPPPLAHFWGEGGQNDRREQTGGGRSGPRRSRADRGNGNGPEP